VEIVAFLLCLGLIGWVAFLQMSVERANRRLDKAEAALEALKSSLRIVPKAPPAASEEASKPQPLAGPKDAEVAGPPRKAPSEAGDKPTSQPPATSKPPEQVAAKVAPPEPRGPGMGERFAKWMMQNWFYAVSAISLALAGLFLVQYGIEQGYLTPTMRVAAAIALGLILIGAGEYIRRRWGDGEDSATAYLPSTFSGAGIVSLYGGVLAARSLYGLIGAGTAFGGLVAVSAAALLMGWLYGPFLAAIGLLGAGAAPFLVGGEAQSATLFYLYYGLIGVAGLAIDAWRRWAWVSILALVVAAGGGLAVYLGSEDMPGFAVLLTVLALASMAIPRRELGPAHDGGAPLGRLGLFGAAGRNAGPIGFPTWVAWSTLAVVSAMLLFLPRGGPGELLLTGGLLTALILAIALWAWQARALAEAVIFPVVSFLLLIPTEGWLGTALMRTTERAQDGSLIPVVPLEATLLLVMAAHGTAGAAWRSLKAGKGAQGLFWGLVAALFAPLVPMLLELFWLDPRVPGTYAWAVHAVALAALMVAIAVRFARAEGAQKRRTSWAALAALSLIALALFVVLTKAALTLALGVLLVTGAVLDRRFRLPELQYFVAAGVMVLTYRTLFAPGLEWAFDAPWWEFLLAFLGALAGLFAAWKMLPTEPRLTARAFLESGGLLIAGAFLTTLIWRLIEENAGGANTAGSHWSMGMSATIWLLAAAAQVYRMRLGGRMRWVRLGMASLFGLFGGIFLLVGLTFANPLLSERAGFLTPDPTIHGPYLLDTLLLAYLLPAVVLGLIARLCKARWARILWAVPAVGLAAYWGFLAIRRIWWGGEVYIGRGWLDGELYTYTVVLIAIGALLLWQAIAKGSTVLRRAALVVIGLAVCKVFLIDASGLTGLFRVFSFLALGLALAGLAWLNRWAAQEAAERAGLDPDDGGDDGPGDGGDDGADDGGAARDAPPEPDDPDFSKP